MPNSKVKEEKNSLNCSRGYSLENESHLFMNCPMIPLLEEYYYVLQPAK